MAENRLEILLDELLSGRISPEDAALFVTYVDDPQRRGELETLLTQRFDNDEYEVMPGLVRQARVKAALLSKLGKDGLPVEVRIVGRVGQEAKEVEGYGEAVLVEMPARGEARRRVAPFMRWAVAAAILLVVGGGAWWWMGRGKGSEKDAVVVANKFANEVEPGSNKAILQLADGSKINLTDGADGKLAEQGGAQVVRKNGELLYESGKKAKDVYYNMVSTPAAGQYHIILADGTQVWLDALSSIRYPTAFSGGKREVEITGQAYLEVAHNAAQPFFVKARNETVEVLGTSFNVNAYDDEPVLHTTLVEGAVRVVSKSNGASLLLKPGEQAEMNRDAGLKLLTGTDMEATLAWKNGLFTYNGAPIDKIMREVSRWYGVEVVYADKINEQFVADIPRNVPLTKLLTLLSGTRQVHFSVENKKVTVMR